MMNPSPSSRSAAFRRRAVDKAESENIKGIVVIWPKGLAAMCVLQTFAST